MIDETEAGRRNIVRKICFGGLSERMIEKEDWEEAGCCFRPTAKGAEISREEGQRPIQEIIEGFDALLAKDAKDEARAYLETWLSRCEEEGNWANQITILNEMMGFYRNSGEKEKGLWSVKKGFDLIAEHRLSETVSGGTTFVNGATTMKAFGEAKAALPYYEQAFRAYGQSLAPGDYRFGGLFNNMALAYEDLGDYKKAEVYYKKALDIMEALRPGSILEIAVTWVNLAVLYEKWGREEEIGDFLERAMEGFHSPLVPHDAYYGFNCRKCAETFGHFGYFRMKKELSGEADRIYGKGGR